MPYGKPIFHILLMSAVCVSLIGCKQSKATQNADAAMTAARFAARERQLLEMCDEIAIEREILSAKHNALIIAYHLDERLEPVAVKRCQ
jgi:hypothetical protein